MRGCIVCIDQYVKTTNAGRRFLFRLTRAVSAIQPVRPVGICQTHVKTNSKLIRWTGLILGPTPRPPHSGPRPKITFSHYLVLSSRCGATLETLVEKLCENKGIFERR
jgi:hypothetical protein